MAILTLGVTTESKDVKVAHSENNKIINNILSDLYSIGINREDIQTVDISIKKAYDYGDGKQTFRGYEVVHILKIVVRDINLVGQSYTLAVENGTNSDININFTASNLEKYYDRALVLAVKDAVDKGKLMANALGVRIKKVPSNISEVVMSQTPRPNPYQFAVMDAKEISTPISEGVLEVKAEVNAVFCTY
ncbi:SIMPL domain-containing protein [Asaccharospora irregularis]|uniref:SIMPL domain-containing protein n=1 Tax=Asaccharospora irregularis DSM 2635 TaxID=1121321 RepID=A0A1M5KBS7_9FIRM|nr:SIMPL domain-containing protein [Asaccharospora irregularis]SHG50374.1 hypothetical protein SAMN04488530_102207 [Asaccharospora irregularis DSM 2635]